jgi:hypothetical protein
LARLLQVMKMENNQSLDFYDENNENLDIYPELRSYLTGALPISFQSTTTTSDVKMQEATELVGDDEEPSEYSHSEMAELAHHSVSAGSVVADPQLPFFTSSHRYSRHVKTDEHPLERSAEKPAATINEEDCIYVRTLTPVAPEDLSKVEAINLSAGKGRFKFIGDEHVMTYASFLQHAKIIRSDTQKKINLSYSEKKKIYSRDGCLFLMDSGKEIQVETRPVERPPEKPAAAINDKDYVYVRTLMPVAPEDLSKIKQIGKGTVKFIGDEHVVTYANFLKRVKIIRSDTRGVMDLSCSEKRKIYCRDESLFLSMDSGEEIQVETRPFKRPDKKRKHEDITKHNEPEDADVAAPAAKRKKAGEVAETAIVSRNKNRFFRKKLNINDDKNSNTEDEGDYDMGKAQNGPR